MHKDLNARWKVTEGTCNQISGRDKYVNSCLWKITKKNCYLGVTSSASFLFKKTYNLISKSCCYLIRLFELMLSVMFVNDHISFTCQMIDTTCVRMDKVNQITS
uniref:Uncharacterized protein n=1 Tax=Oryza brachyantha TaxID=4533 RepID=J3MRT0_ORYBR